MVTMQDVRRRLDADEVDYAEAAALGPDALPHLAALAVSDDTVLASKAVYLASVIGGDRSADIVAEAAQRGDPVVRVAAAAALRNLPVGDFERVGDALLDDDDPGVRKVAIGSVASADAPALTAKVRRAAEEDPEDYVRDTAARFLPPTQ
ncbi:HEAT repeat domain-containing protein [Actinokineospora soli]|uniref:HEAT repeat domain-containing protein n=1 Tax=Actinokineospora soli TaxID=1048753 RepID=A0ABW2TIT0_9PSEU